MAYNFRASDRDQAFLLPPDVRDWLPDDHLAWFILDVVDQLDLDPFLKAYRAGGHGRSAYAPRMHPDEQVAQAGHDVGAGAGADLGGVLGQGDVAEVVRRLNGPMPTQQVGEAGGVGQLERRAWSATGAIGSVSGVWTLEGVGIASQEVGDDAQHRPRVDAHGGARSATGSTSPSRKPCSSRFSLAATV